MRASPKRAFRALLLGLLLTVIALSANDLEQVRTWTSSDGATLRARLLSLDATEQTVRIRRDDGRVFNMKWERLCDADQALLRSSLQPQPPAQISPAAASSTAEEPLPKKFELRRVPMIKQKRNFCVPASAAMIAGYHDIKTDQDEVAQLSSEASISNEGTYPSDMLLAMKKLGFEGRSLLWRDADTFENTALPAIRRALVDEGPVYISFRPGVFGDMGHGCVIIGYQHDRQKLIFHNPWGNVFEKKYAEVAEQGHGVVFIQPPITAPSASHHFTENLQQRVPHFCGDMLQLSRQLQQSGQPFELIWCSRDDSSNEKRFAQQTALREGRKIIEFAIKRNPAIILPASPAGQTQCYLFVTRAPQSGTRFVVREITEDGWGTEKLETLGRLTREWATAFNRSDLPAYQTDNRSATVWELPMIELSE